MAGGWSWVMFKVSSNPNYPMSVILACDKADSPSMLPAALFLYSLFAIFNLYHLYINLYHPYPTVSSCSLEHILLHGEDKALLPLTLVCQLISYWCFQLLNWAWRNMEISVVETQHFWQNSPHILYCYRNWDRQVIKHNTEMWLAFSEGSNSSATFT